MIPEIAASITALKNATDLTSFIIKSKIDDVVREKTNELHQTISDIQLNLMKVLASNQELLEENSILKEQISKLKNFTKESVNYTLYEVASGFFVYAEKEAVQSGSPTIWYCAHCYQKAEKSILQRMEQTYDGTFYYCPNCQNKFINHEDVPPFTI
jgi:cell fate (sporulation/competence/biofilm development) regulator YmcA (YheA/YmcA/DUF963 family)/ribosomal protein L37AE/L43A